MRVMMSKNIIKLTNDFTKDIIYQDGTIMRVYLHLLLNASYKRNFYKHVRDNKEYTIERGQLIIGRKKLAAELNISEHKVRDTLSKLVSTNKITTVNEKFFTIVTINEYDKFNQNDNSCGTELSSKSATTNIVITNVITYYNTLCSKNLGKARLNTSPKRAKIIAQFWDVMEQDENNVKDYFTIVSQSDFLMGKNDRNWKPDFDWLMQHQNIEKVLGGRYNNKTDKTILNAPKAEPRQYGIAQTHEEYLRQTGRLK